MQSCTKNETYHDILYMTFRRVRAIGVYPRSDRYRKVSDFVGFVMSKLSSSIMM